MKKLHLLLVALGLTAAATAYAQNTFPASGNVGIGTTSPADRLQINSARPIIFGSSGGNGVYGSQIGFNTTINTGVVPNTITKLGGTNQQGGAIITVDYWGNFSLQTQYAGTEDVSTIAYAPQFTFSNNGSLGIGTMGPDSILHVSKANSNGDVMFHLQNAGAGNATASLKIGEGAPEGQYMVLANLGVDNSSRVYAVGPGASGVFAIHTGVSGYTPGSTGNERMRIDGNGNVGIGTASPDGRLNISGGPSWTANNWSKSIRLDGSAALEIGGGTSTRYGIGNSSGVLYVFDTTAEDISTPANYRMVINNGNVGIGTTNPTEKLSVNGKIRAKEVIVDTGWSDYVFADDYKLQSLSDVEAQIKTNKHLPGVPSAQEVAEKGVSVGDMQAVLLAKIEELTLHQIELEKRVNAQQAEITRLKAATP